MVVPEAAVGFDCEVAAVGPGEVIFLMSTWLREQVGLLAGEGAAEMLVGTQWLPQWDHSGRQAEKKNFSFLFSSECEY